MIWMGNTFGYVIDSVPTASAGHGLQNEVAPCKLAEPARDS
jgi:hypothetical protein